MNRKAVAVNRCFLVLGILLLLFYLLQGVTVRFGQSMLWVWALGGGVCIARYFLWKGAWKRGKKAPFPRWLLMIERTVLIAFLAVFFAVEGVIAAAAGKTPPEGLDALIVLGAKVNDDGPSGSLRERIAAAADYLRRNPGTVAVASGGQGDNEPMSEALCIYQLLTEAGIEPERIEMEDRSTNTLENLTNSFALLDGQAETVGLVTNDFHIYRALRVGSRLGGYELFGVPARSTVPGYIHYAMREFCALAVSWVRGTIS